MARVTPLYDRVLVRRLSAQEEKVGLLYIPDSAKEKPQEGIVIAVGPGVRNAQGILIPLSVQVGDKVLFGKYSGNDIKIEDQELMVMKEDEILLTLGPDDALTEAL